jgi:hypothetical protein
MQGATFHAIFYVKYVPPTVYMVGYAVGYLCCYGWYHSAKSLSPDLQQSPDTALKENPVDCKTLSV